MLKSFLRAALVAAALRLRRPRSPRRASCATISRAKACGSRRSSRARRAARRPGARPRSSAARPKPSWAAAIAGEPRALTRPRSLGTAQPRELGRFREGHKAITPKDWSERYELQERATPPPTWPTSARRRAREEAQALALLGDIYAMREIWRPALNAYAESLKLAEDAPLRKIYEDLREKRGFRIRIQGRFGRGLAARLLQLLGAAGAGTRRLHALRRGLRRRQRRNHHRECAALRRWTAPRRALRLRAAPGPGLGGRREPPEARLTTRSTCGTARRRGASPGATTCCPAPARKAPRSSR